MTKTSATQSPARKTTAKTDAGITAWIDRSMVAWGGVGGTRYDWIITLPSGATQRTWITLAQAVELEAEGIAILAKGR
jgi:hypothetical protein